MKKIFNLLIVGLFTFTFLMCSEVKAYRINSNCYDSPENSTYCDVNILPSDPFTDFEIHIGILGRIKSINTITGASVNVGNEITVIYNQSVDTFNKIIHPIVVPYVSIKYEIPNDFLRGTWPNQYPNIENTARYMIGLYGYTNLITNMSSDGSFQLATRAFHDFYIDIPFTKYADLDHDGYINRYDINFLKNYLRNKDVNTILSQRAFDFLQADVNYDRIINEDDLEAIYTYIYNNPSDTRINSPLPNQNITLYGDANLDCEVNEEDVILILNHASGNPLSFIQSKINSDVNNDGVIDVVDAYLVRNQLIGRKTSTPLNNKVYYYGDVDLDSKVGFSDITKLISLRYASDSTNIWSQEVLETLEMSENKTPGFSEIISLIDYVYEPHNITYNLNGGTWGKDTYVESFRSSKLPDNLPTPINEGYYFDYWVTDAESFNGYDLTGKVIKAVNKNIVYKAVWERDML